MIPTDDDHIRLERDQAEDPVALQTAIAALVVVLATALLATIALLLAILAFIGAFAMALGPIPWILCSEIFPTRVRGRAMSVATFVIWTACYVVAQTFPILNDNPAIGPANV
mgnify:CR=1 FL=1